MLDPNIPLAVRMPQLESPWDIKGKMLSLQSVGQENQLRSMQLAREQRQENDARTYSEMYKQAASLDPETGGLTVDHGKALAFLQQKAPHLIPVLLQDESKTELAALNVQRG